MLLVQKDLNNPDNIKIEERTSPDRNTVCRAPVGASADIIDILDDINEQGEVIGKKAVINPDKLAAKQAALAQAEQARVDAEQIKQTRRQQLRDAVAGFESLTAAQKWALVKDLLVEVTG